MALVRLFHWRAAEAEPLIDEIRKAGYEVDYPGDQPQSGLRSIREGGYHALVIDLTRKPSYGRYLGVEIRAQKATRHLPIVYVDGDPEKVERIREALPDALFTSRAKLGAALKKAKPVLHPVATVGMMASYGSRTTAQKMGIKEGSRVAVMEAPRGYATFFGELPAGVTFEEDPAEVLPITLWFVHDPDVYLSSLPAMRKVVAAKSKLWVIWPKAASKKGAQSGVTQTLIRESAIDIGLVDYKICSVNET
jgi:hypothetical protein